MAEPIGRTSTTRIVIRPSSIVLVLVAFAAAILAAEILVSARRVLSWVVACAVCAALIGLLVHGLSRFMRRWIAILLVLVGIGAVAGILIFGVFKDLDREVTRLQEVVPQASSRLEQSERVGNLAREVRLNQRVTTAVEDLSKPSSGLAGQAVTSGGTYAVCLILTVLFLSWGPRLARAGIAQLDDERASLVREISNRAFDNARRYVLQAIAQSTVVGLIGYGACRWFDVPAPAPLALLLAVMTLLPNLGIIVGAMPILLLAFGLIDAPTGWKLTVLFVALQVVSSTLVQKRIVRRAQLYVGPAIVSVAFLAGFELYGVGGALYGAALMVFLVAAIDANDQVRNERTPEKTRAVSEDTARVG